MATVKLQNIYKRYEDSIAVNNINLEIQDHELLVLVGPSGCGKSTTLRMIAGLEEISEGDLLIDGQRMNDVPPKGRDIAMVFQNYALYPHMSVYDNMAFGLKMRKVDKKQIDKQVREAAAILDIDQLLKRKPKDLSGGQRQRVALGRAIVREPKVFLMDEPLSNLDAKLRVQMRTEIIKLHQRLNATMVYVTHDQTEALTMGDRIVVMKDGVVQQVDTPDQIYKQPNNQFVAGFIGSPAMNFIEGKLAQEDGKLVFQSHNINITIPQGRAETLVEKGYAGKPIVLGIRPEALHDELSFIEASPESCLTATVEVVENMGSELYLYINTAREKLLTARVSTRTPYAPGEAVRLAMDVNQTHFFDPETELRIS